MIERRDPMTITRVGIRASQSVDNWQERGACALTPPPKDADLTWKREWGKMIDEKFYLDWRSSKATEAAKAVCAGCPVRDKCLEDAMANEVDAAREGIWGGRTPAERGELARERAA